MQQNETLITTLKQWLQANGFSWLFISKEETIKEALLKTGTILLLFPILAIALCIRIMYLLYAWTQNVITRDTKKSKEYQLVPMILVSVLLAMSVVGMAFGLHAVARYNNVKLLEQIDELRVYKISVNKYSSGNNILCATFRNIADAMKNYRAGKEVLRMRNQLEVDANIDQNLRFQDAENYALFLYTLRNQDDEMREIVNKTDHMQRLENVAMYYSLEARESYLDGNYYQAAAQTAHYFNQYIKQEDFNFSGVNNQMHILRLLSHYRWELTTNRAFARQFDAYMNGDEESVRSLLCLDSLCDKHTSLLELSAYFKALATYDSGELITAIHQFEQCAVCTNDDLLKQYCALMCVRAAFWQYDKNRDNQNYSFFYKTLQANSSHVKLVYFQSDIRKYAELVERIKEGEL